MASSAKDLLTPPPPQRAVEPPEGATAFVPDKAASLAMPGSPGILEWLQGGELQRVVADTRASVLRAFHAFETATGTALPGPENAEADALRAKMAAVRAEWEPQLQAAQAATARQQETVKRLVEGYEADGEQWVERHEDALQFKYLAESIAKEARRQRDGVEELLANEHRQYALQAKDCAAQLAMGAQLSRLLASGAPFAAELQGLLAFQKLSHLADSSRDGALEPSMVHERIKEFAPHGVPSAPQLFHRFADLQGAAQALLWRLPDSGLAGRVWQKMTTRLAPEDPGLATIRGYLAAGNVRAAREWYRQWMAAHVEAKADPAGIEVPEELRRFGDALDAHLQAAELRRYLRAKLLAQQKDLLQ